MIIHNPILTGSFTFNGTDVSSVTGSSTFSASFASSINSLNAATASLNSFSASVNTFTASAATTGSNTFVGNQVVTGSLTVSSSITTPGTLTAQTLVVQTITSSVDFVTGSTRFGSTGSNTHTFTGSVNITGSAHSIFGKVSVGTGSAFAESTFDVVGTNVFRESALSAHSWFPYTNGSAYVSCRTGSAIYFREFHETSTTTFMTITGSKVGIGTTTPIGTLDITVPSGPTNINIINSGSQYGNVVFKESGISKSYLQYVSSTYSTTARQNSLELGTNSSSTFIAFRPNDTEAMRVTGGGNIGIGVTNPSYKLVVNSATDGMSGGIVGSTYGIRFDNGGAFAFTGSAIHGVDTTLVGSYQSLAINASQLIFGISATEKMRITSGGYVGIGITNPTHDLEVSGNMRYLNTSGNAELKISRGTTSNGSGLGLYTGTTHNWLLGTAWGTTGNHFVLYNVGTSKIMLRGDYSTNGISISTDHTNLGSAALNVYTSGSGAANSGNQIWLRGGCTNITNNSNAIVLSYSDSTLYSHAIKTKHNSAAINGNSIDFYVWNYGTDSSSTIGTRQMMSIDGTGVLKPNQPAFQVNRGSSANQGLSGDSTILEFNNVNYDTTGAYNTSTFRFTAPVAGVYLFTCQARYDGTYAVNAYIRTFFTINGASGTPVNYNYGHQIMGSNTGYSVAYESGTISAVLKLAAGDYVNVRGGASGGSTNLHNESQFSGYLLG